jgi:murein DD-endopeptidase MepM/ murein hydrolase activator NlpD
MMRRLAAALGILVVLALAAALAVVVWRLRAPERAAPPPLKPAASASPAAAESARASTIIDLPGDPALVRRATQNAPRPISLAVPAALTPQAPSGEGEVFFVSEPLTPAGGGYLGKYVENGQQADALNAELAMTSAGAGAGAEDAGDDDDGGDQTPDDVPAVAPLTGANTLQLDVIEGGENGRPQLKQTILRPKLPQKISELLAESGYEPASAGDVEAAARQLFNIQTLRPGAVALAVGAVDPSGAYRVAQLAMFQDGEYIGTIARLQSGAYGEGAEPAIPAGLLDDSDRAPTGERFTLADGVYSAGLRSAVPESVVREAVRLLGQLADLGAGLSTGETLRLIYAAKPRVRGQASRVIYAGLAGPIAADCYAFAMSDGGFRCFVKDEAAPPAPPPGPSGPAPLPPQRGKPGGESPGPVGDSGASASGGILAPIRGAPVTSLFGMRFHPILHITRMHKGIDFGAQVGSQVRAAADGVVEVAGEVRGYGNRIVLKHDGFETTYNHLSEFDVALGAHVRQGQIIALSGNTGLSTGPHLHFEYQINGEVVDPLPHMGKEFQGRAPTSVAHGGAGGGSVPTPPTADRPPPPDPLTLAAFAAAKAEIDAALAQAQP